MKFLNFMKEHWALVAWKKNRAAIINPIVTILL